MLYSVRERHLRREPVPYTLRTLRSVAQVDRRLELFNQGRAMTTSSGEHIPPAGGHNWMAARCYSVPYRC